MNNAVVMAQNQILIEVAKILASSLPGALGARDLRPPEAGGQSDGTMAIARWIMDVGATQRT